MDNRIQLGIGAAVLVGVLAYLAPIRQGFVEFNACVEVGKDYYEKYGTFTDQDLRTHAVHFCNGGTN